MDLILENVRCFQGKHTIPIRPLTFLVGENSSGKSTVLAMLSAISQRMQSIPQKMQFPFHPNFNEPPYNLGNYPTIASTLITQNSSESASHFVIGFQNENLQMEATYKNQDSQPVVAKIIGGILNYHFEIDFEKNSLVFRNQRNQLIDSILIDQELMSNIRRDLSVTFLIWSWGLVANREEENSKRKKLREPILDAFEFLPKFWPTLTQSIAPIRSHPLRTYDAIHNDFQPEGQHIPLLLSRILRQADNKTRSIFLKALESFGAESGLFRSIDVRNLGNQEGDPFQIQVTLSALKANLIDVGYGVSQALPVIVESLTAQEPRLLLQQPEVHLHPRAQAALGTFFVNLVASKSKQFVIETHSDYLVDRVRQEVAKGNIPAEDVMILFFDREGTQAKVYPIPLDKEGNIIDPPSSYREFFLEEEINLLTRTH